jgi:hypothetical protein
VFRDKWIRKLTGSQADRCNTWAHVSYIVPAVRTGLMPSVAVGFEGSLGWGLFRLDPARGTSIISWGSGPLPVSPWFTG